MAQMAAVISFSGGEFSPLIDARSDVTKYASGCRTLQNMLPRIYGAAERRPGTKYIAAAKTATGNCVLAAFEYSTETAYILEFTNLKLRFFVSGGILLDAPGGDPVEVTTPYTSAQLYELQLNQSNDVMWITHPDHPPYKLQRTSATTFTLTEVTFDDGPFLVRNDLDAADGVTMTPSATTGSGKTLTASEDTFTEDHVGALFKLTQPRATVTVSLNKTAPATGVSSSLGIKGAFSFYATASAIWQGTVSLERCADGTNWESVRTFTDRSADYSGNETESGVSYRINVSACTAGTISCDLTIHTSTQDGICRVTAYTSAKVVTITILSDFASTDATTRWAEGSWSAERGYPKTFCLFGERAIYAGTEHEPQTVWLSKVGDYETFDEGTDDDASFSIEIASNQRNAIEWIAGLEALVLGTSGGEWRIRASGDIEEPLTPTNYSVRQQSTYGSKAMQCQPANNVVLFVDRSARKIREMVWREEDNKYDAPDVTLLCEHITSGGIVDIAWQRNPESVIWLVLASSPYLISITYNRQENVIAASTHPIGGTGVVDSVAVIPGDEEDEVWVSVKRTINSVAVRYIEQMQPRAFSSQATAFFVDSGLIYDGTATSTITGLDHLEGEEVCILGDGVKHPNETVASGSITLDSDVEYAVVGLPYEYVVKPMRLDANVLSRGSTKHITRIVLSFYQTLGAEYGRVATELYDLFEDILINKYGISDAGIFASLEDVLQDRYGEVAGAAQFAIDWPQTSIFEAIPLYTGDKELTFEGGFSETDDLIVTGDGPLPCTLLSITAYMEVI